MYSQYEEEKYVIDAFAGKAGGRFLDIGAHHPTDKSNTRALIELGWSGILIEPSPGPFINLMRACVECGGVKEEMYGERKALACGGCGGQTLYGYSERLTLMQACVATVPGLVRLELSDDALSSSGDTQPWKSAGASFYGYAMVPAITPASLANQFGGFDMISIDTEGTSVDLLLHMLTLGWGPRCFVVEHDNRMSEIMSAATSLYNVVYGNGTNLVLVRK